MMSHSKLSQGLQLAFVLEFMSLAICFGDVLLDYQVDNSDVNLIFLECYGNGQIKPNPDAVFEFLNHITGTLLASSSPRQHENTLRFEVTPTTEAEIHCFIGGASSQAVYIAGECSKPVN